jgi:hypothetical protein
MKIVKTASGKQTIKLSKSEWESIGKKAGWMKKARLAPHWMDQVLKQPHLKDQLEEAFNRYVEAEQRFKQYKTEQFSPNSPTIKPYEVKKQELDKLQLELNSQWNSVLDIINKNTLNDSYVGGKTIPTPDDLRSLFIHNLTVPV